MWVFLLEVNLCRFVIVCLCWHCRWRSNYQKEKAWILFTGLAMPHVCPFSLFSCWWNCWLLYNYCL